ncbi:MAG: leucine-rich repeat domain-containing protein, partial [Bacilli bacterium]
MSIYEMATLVKNDLEALGMGGVYISNIRPNVISPSETLIAIRKTTNTGLFAFNDYHFMKYHPDGGYWTHKPGTTAILKYNHQPADKGWIQEGIIDSSGTAAIGNLVYNSEIYYIVYNWKGLIIQGNTLVGFTPQAGFNGTVNIPNGVTSIGNNAFANRTQLTQISIPESVTSIGSNAFLNCSNLEKVVIQREIGGITSLGSNAFLGCSSLETIEVPKKRILDYLYATNWSNYSSYMHYIEPITDGLTITSVGEESEFYLF